MYYRKGVLYENTSGKGGANVWSADHTGTDKEAAERRHSCAVVKAKG